MSEQTQTALEPICVGTAEAAKLLCLSRSQFYSLWSRGLTPEGQKLGGKRLFLVAELRAWAEAGFPPRSVWIARWMTSQMNRRLNGLKKQPAKHGSNGGRPLPADRAADCR